MPIHTKVAGKGIDTKEQAEAEFWRYQGEHKGKRVGDPKEHLQILEVKEERTKLGVTFEVTYGFRPPKAEIIVKAAGLPNATSCDGCVAFDIKKEDCQEGNRPGTCGHRPEVKRKPAEVNAHITNINYQESTDSKYQCKHKAGSDEIEVSRIIISGWNPRKQFDEDKIKELAGSIKSIGLLEPILVRPKGTKYELVIGERRLRAARMLKNERIRAEVRDMTDDEVLDAMIAENVCREDLNPIEEANHLKRVLEVGKLTQIDLAKRLGKPQSWVSERLRLVDAPSKLQEAIICQQIFPTSAVELLGQKSKDGYQETLDQVFRMIESGEKVSEKEVREIIRQRTGRIPAPDFLPSELKAFASDARVSPEAVDVLKRFAPYPIYIEAVRKLMHYVRLKPGEALSAKIVQDLCDSAVRNDYDNDRAVNLAYVDFDVKGCGAACSKGGHISYPEGDGPKDELEYCIDRDCFAEKKAKAKAESEEAEKVHTNVSTNVGTKVCTSPEPEAAELPTELPSEPEEKAPSNCLECPEPVVGSSAFCAEHGPKITKCHVLSCTEQTLPDSHWCEGHQTKDSRKPKESPEDPDERRIVTRAQYKLQGRRLFLNPGDERPPEFEDLPEVG